MLMNIIGSGNVAQTLGKLFVNCGLVEIGGIYNRTSKKAFDAIQFIGQGTFYKSSAELPSADITLITTADDNIKEAANSYCLNKNIKPGQIVAHCSGVLSSDCMISLRDRGCFLASIHPMRSFIQPSLSVNEYSGTYCALEGDKAATDILRELFTSIGSNIYEINKEKKALYHAAGVFASNYMLTLSEQALNCLEEASVDKDVAISLVVSLMQSTLTNLANTKSPKAALTGPIKRGDTVTIEKHLAAFSDKSQRELYETLLAATNKLLVDG
jgi:predicted short-subunit dehydrogenase-like oxidoreductase (DUF2520 family)